MHTIKILSGVKKKRHGNKGSHFHFVLHSLTPVAVPQVCVGGRFTMASKCLYTNIQRRWIYHVEDTSCFLGNGGMDKIHARCFHNIHFHQILKVSYILFCILMFSFNNISWRIFLALQIPYFFPQ